MTLLGFVGGTTWPAGAGGHFTKDPP